MNLVWKLLRQNISKAQFAGFFIANIIGLTIVLLGIQFFFDINPLFSEKEEILKRDFIVVTKKVGILSTLSSGSTGFSKTELEDIKKENFVKAVGPFVASNYRVYAGIEFGGRAIRTDMFFESVPDDFIDVKSESWGFTEDQDFIPIIVPKNYLDLYNFGFAEARSMPKITESMVSMLSLKVYISGNNERKEFKGNVVGFSNRINTILVPETFMMWANSTFGGEEERRPSRLMIEVNNPSDPNIATFLNSKGYVAEGEDAAASKMSFFLKMLVGIVIVIGIIICILSFFILTLSIYLLIEKNTDKLQNLRLIGYSKKIITRPYQLLVITMNISVLFVSLLIVYIARMQYLSQLGSMWKNLETTGLFPSFAGGIIVVTLISCLNMLVISKKIR
jgi:Cell division protein